MTLEFIEPKEFPYLNYKQYSFSLGVKSGDFVFTSGHTASEYDQSIKKVVCKGGLEEQTRKIHEKLKLILEAAGTSFDDVIKVVDYVSPMAVGNTEVIDSVRNEYFSDGMLPVCSRVFVDGLVRTDALLEVECVALTGKEKSRENSSRFSKNGYPHAVKKGHALFFSNSSVVPLTNLRVQSEQIYHDAENILEELGATFRDVVKINEFTSSAALQEYSDFYELDRVRNNIFGSECPATTSIGVGRLSDPRSLMELEGMALLGKGDRTVFGQNGPITFSGAAKQGLVFLSCLTEELSARSSANEKEIIYQTKYLFDRLNDVLKKFHTSQNNILKTVDFFLERGRESYRDTTNVRRQIFSTGFPASTGVVVRLLPRPGSEIALDCIATTDL